MSDASDDDIERIREQKREELKSRLSTDEPIRVDDAEHFDDLVETHPVLLVDFYADWCGPCQMIEPIVENIAATTDATVATVDVDERQDVARYYGVQSIPVLLLFADGEQVQRLVGAQDESTLRSLVEKYT